MARAKLILLFLTIAPTLIVAPAAPAQEATAADPGRASRERDSVARRKSLASSLAPVSQTWWLGTSAMILALGGAGAVCLAARKQCGGGPAVKLQVVGRVNLPPRHSVFAVKAGGRTLLIGTGPQGGPTLLGELEDDAVEDHSPVAAALATPPAPHRPIHPQSRFDVRIGDES